MNQIIYVPPQALTPYSKNARTHDGAQIEKIVASIREFGWTNPILADANLMVIAGHGRLAAALSMGLDAVPVIQLTGMSDAQKRAYILADNRLALDAGWDDELLAHELGALADAGFDLSLTGFNSSELDALLNDLEVGDGADADDVPEAAEPVTRPGDLWLLGKHRLLCGDATVQTDVDRLLGGREPNLMATDPPYGVKYDAGVRAEAKGSKKTAREHTGTLQNDDRFDRYDAYVLFRGAIAYVWHAGIFTGQVALGLERAGFEIKSQIIWNKSTHALGRSDYHWKHEPCWYAVRAGCGHSWRGGRSQMTVWDVPSVSHEKGAGGKTAHPTQKPVELYVRAYQNHTKRGDDVYEPFGGSGSALIAAEKTGRVALVMELDPKFCDVIIRRWEQFSGGTATLCQS